MHDEKVKLFDEFFVKNYKYLKQFTRSIDPQHYYEDTLNDVYIRLRTRIEINGYEGQEFLNYTRCGIMNFYKSEYRSKKKKQFIDIDDPDFYQHIEEKLLITQIQELQDKEQELTTQYLNTMIYQYIEEKFGPKDQFLFRTYFLLKHKRLNYKQLSETSGQSITTVSNIIKKMKKDIRENLFSYIVSGETITNE